MRFLIFGLAVFTLMSCDQREVADRLEEAARKTDRSFRVASIHGFSTWAQATQLAEAIARRPDESCALLFQDGDALKTVIALQGPEGLQYEEERIYWVEDAKRRLFVERRHRSPAFEGQNSVAWMDSSRGLIYQYRGGPWRAVDEKTLSLDIELLGLAGLQEFLDLSLWERADDGWVAGSGQPLRCDEHDTDAGAQRYFLASATLLDGSLRFDGATRTLAMRWRAKRRHASISVEVSQQIVRPPDVEEPDELLEKPGPSSLDVNLHRFLDRLVEDGLVERVE